MSYAIFKAVGEQVRAQEGDRIWVPLMEEEPGSKVSFDEVLLTSDGKEVKAGQPTVKGARVEAEVLGHVKGEKLYVFKFKRRKKYRRKTGHRQQYTELKVTKLKLG